MTALASCSDSSANSTPIVGCDTRMITKAKKPTSAKRDDAHRRDPRRPEPRQEVDRPVHLEGNLLWKKIRRVRRPDALGKNFPVQG